MLHRRLPHLTVELPLTSPSPVITNAVYKNDAETMQRLQLRVQNHGDVPSALSSSPAAPSYRPSSTSTNGYTNGYQSNTAYTAYSAPSMPARMPANCVRIHWTYR